VAGNDVLDEVEHIKTQDDSATVTAVGCGEFVPGITPAAGYLLNVPDQSFEGFTTVFHSWLCVRIIASNASAVQKFKDGLKILRCTFLTGEDAAADCDESIVDVTVYAKQLAPPHYDESCCIVAKPADVLSLVEAWCLNYRNQWVLDRRDR
jgi:hypothetical protein